MSAISREIIWSKEIWQRKSEGDEGCMVGGTSIYGPASRSFWVGTEF